jgi:hypothetical protein
MKLFDFQLLELDEKLELLHRQGIYVGKRKEDGLCFLLYQLDCFYVEVCYRFYRRQVMQVKSFSSTTVLDPYLDQINVEALVSIQ